MVHAVDAAGGMRPHIMARPTAPEQITLDREFADAFGQAQIVDICAGRGAQAGNQAANTLSRRH
jgi:hypothetical protein